MGKLIFVILSMNFLLSCSTSSDSYLVRWWNGNLPLSENEYRAWSDCFDSSKMEYPDSVDPVGEKRIKYRRECMKNKGY